MISAQASFETAHASKYLVQLCRHFAHKIDVTYTESEADAALPTGPATLRADDRALHVTVTAPDEAGLARAKHIIDDHLARFAFRESFERMPWNA